MGIVFGIDYGSKLSGNTVIAILKEHQIYFMDVDAKVDADQFIRNAVDHFKPELVFIDAPLSLPGVYRQLPDFTDYHFRVADRDTKAMSPMFLGGLAARAMEIKQFLEDQDIEVKETYPRLIANRFELKSIGYKTNKSALKECTKQIKNCLKGPLEFSCSEVRTWHHLDALLALMSALAYKCGDFSTYGDPREGLIYI